MGKRKRKGPSSADRADRHRLYQRAVQTPDADIEFFVQRFEAAFDRKPWSLREDFCGTALTAVRWCEEHPERTAIGVDLDGPTLEWGREHNLSTVDAEVAGRVDLREANVLDVVEPRVDVICAMNFSYGVFKTREALRKYFEVAHRSLNDEGIFVCELYGGTEAIVDFTEDPRDVAGGGVQYIWEQERFNPINHDTLCHIHFEFPDGSKLRKAFTYDWRLWTIPELRELFAEAGFSDCQVYWERTDEDGDGTGEYVATEEEENQESWLVYLVAKR